MGRYALRRSMQTLPLLVGIAAISYLFMRLAPGGPLALMAHNPRMTQAQLDNIKANLGLDKPVGVQFALWLGGLLRGDWGYSYVDGRPVLQVILERAPATIELMGAGFLIAFALAVPIGLVDLALSVPALFLLLVLFSITGGASAAVIVVYLGLFGWMYMARIVRARILTLKGLDFVQGARAIGASPARIVLRHLLPNALGAIIVTTTLQIAYNMLAEAALDFLGYGVAAGTPMWGVMLNAAEQRLLDAPGLIIAPGLALTGAILCVNLVGDGLRDALDPRQP